MDYQDKVCWNPTDAQAEQEADKVIVLLDRAKLGKQISWDDVLTLCKIPKKEKPELRWDGEDGQLEIDFLERAFREDPKNKKRKETFSSWKARLPNQTVKLFSIFMQANETLNMKLKPAFHEGNNYPSLILTYLLDMPDELRLQIIKKRKLVPSRPGKTKTKMPNSEDDISLFSDNDGEESDTEKVQRVLSGSQLKRKAQVDLDCSTDEESNPTHSDEEFFPESATTGVVESGAKKHKATRPQRTLRKSTVEEEKFLKPVESDSQSPSSKKTKERRTESAAAKKSNQPSSNISLEALVQVDKIMRLLAGLNGKVPGLSLVKLREESRAAIMCVSGKCNECDGVGQVFHMERIYFLTNEVSKSLGNEIANELLGVETEIRASLDGLLNLS